ADPIFAAIDSHRRAFVELTAFLGKRNAIERSLCAADPRARQDLEARLAEFCEVESQLGCAEIEAADEIAAIVPKTLAGTAVGLRYVRERFEEDGHAMFEEDGYRELLFRTECVICSAIGFPLPLHGRHFSAGNAKI